MVFVTQRARPWQRCRGRHGGRHTADTTAIPKAGGRATRTRAEVVVRERRAEAHRGDWNRSCRSCPDTYPHSERDPSRGPSLPWCYSPPRSAVLRPPRTPAAHDSTSPSAYTRRSALTRAAQTGLSCSVRLRARVLRPIPHRDLPRDLRTETRPTWPSPRHDRLGSRIVNL